MTETRAASEVDFDKLSKIFSIISEYDDNPRVQMTDIGRWFKNSIHLMVPKLWLTPLLAHEGNWDDVGLVDEYLHFYTSYFGDSDEDD